METPSLSTIGKFTPTYLFLLLIVLELFVGGSPEAFVLAALLVIQALVFVVPWLARQLGRAVGQAE